VGAYALTADTKGAKSVAIGTGALETQNFTSDTDSFNVAVGFQAGNDITTGEKNTLIGSLAGDALTTGANNVVMGYHALGTATTADLSTVVGYQAGESITEGDRNTLYGTNAGQSLTTGSSNTFIGGASTGSGNGAGKAMTTGSKNTILGTFDGNQGGIDIRTSSNYIVLSDGDGNPRLYFNQDGLLHHQISLNNYRIALFENTNNTSGNGTINSRLPSNCNNTSSYHFVGNTTGLGDAIYIYGNGNVVNANNSYGSMSDEKLKENIVDSGSQWDDIKALKVRKYSMKAEKADKANKIGVIAQELESAGMSGLVFETSDRDEDGKDLKTTTKVVNYSVLYMKAVKALQEAMTRIEALETKNDALEARIKKLEDG
jgi:hypothetical protein